MFDYIKRSICKFLRNDGVYQSALHIVYTAKTFDDFHRAKKMINNIEKKSLVTNEELSMLKQHWVFRYKLWKNKQR